VRRVIGPQDEEGESVWQRLRRRKVVQWGITYAAGAWGFLQGLAYVSTLLRWPEQLQRLTGLALLIGLPVVLVLAWYHGDRGEQRIRRTELAILTLLFLVGGGLFWRYQHSNETQTAITRSAAPPAAVATDARPSIAVLPFENRSAKQDDAYFVDGVHDDILTQLTKIGAMKVIARTSVEQFRNTKLTTKEIGEKLGVIRVLEGGVQRAGDRVRVTVQLIDATTDAHVWAETYDRELTAANIFAIQSEVATAIAGALRATLTPAEKARADAVPTHNLDAWESYQIGKQRMSKRTTAGLKEAAAFFHKAINLDPTFALAYTGLADTLDLQVGYSGAPRDATLDEADKAARTALKLDPGLAEAWASSASIAADRKQYDRAETMYRRAIELNPNHATAYHWFSRMLAELGRNDESRTAAQRAVDLDPLSAIINVWLSYPLVVAGRFDEADARISKAIEIDPSMPTPYGQLGLHRAYAMNRIAEAVPLLAKATELDPASSNYPCSLALVNLDLDRVADATRLVDTATKRWPDDVCVLGLSAFVRTYQGDTNGAMQDAQRVLAIDPSNSTALYLLRTTDLRAGHPEVARARYAKAYPELLANEPPKINSSNWGIALDLPLILQGTGEGERARALLDRTEEFIRTIPRLSSAGFGIADAQIFAMRDQKREALTALREAEKVGWRGPCWRYLRDFEPDLDSIRNDPEFKAVFADIERDIARQRAELAARPKDAPLDLGEPRQ
jgi:TolB-like protein/Tfp pilus assembly protein PilF